MSRWHCFSTVLPNIWLLQSSCHLFCNGPWAQDGQRSYWGPICGWALCRHLFSTRWPVMSSCVLHHLLHEETSLSSLRAARVLASPHGGHPHVTEKWLAQASLESPLRLTLEVVESVTLVFLWEVSVQMFFVFLLGCLPFNPCFVGDFYDSWKPALCWDHMCCEYFLAVCGFLSSFLSEKYFNKSQLLLLKYMHIPLFQVHKNVCWYMYVCAHTYHCPKFIKIASWHVCEVFYTKSYASSWLVFYKLNEVLSSIWPASGHNTHISESSLLNCSMASVEDQATIYWSIYFWIQPHLDLALSQHHTV